MIPLQNIYNQVLAEFVEALRERCGVDTSFVDSETIDAVVREIKTNLENKQDLFNKLRYAEDLRMPSAHVSESSSQSSSQSEDSQSSELENEKQERKVDGSDQTFLQKPLSKKQLKLQKKRKQKEWQEEYKNERQLTDKVKNESKKAADYHISALYNLKTKKYITSKNQEQITLNLAIVKSNSDQQLVTSLQGRLSKGDKKEVLALCLKKEENGDKECSREQKLVLLKQMLN